MTDTIIPEPAAEDMIVQFEQSGKLAPRPYLDPRGIPTQGYGSIWNWRANPKRRVTMADPPVDEIEGRRWLGCELQGVCDVLKGAVKVPLTDPEAAALEDFIYNVGVGAFEGSTLLRLLNAGNYAGASNELLKWDHGGSVVLAGLLRRREAEKAVFDEAGN